MSELINKNESEKIDSWFQMHVTLDRETIGGDRPLPMTLATYTFCFGMGLDVGEREEFREMLAHVAELLGDHDDEPEPVVFH